MGHMVPVVETEPANPFTCYLPHHGVLRKGRLSSNIRVVFNGSSRTSSGISLNDILHTGAKLQTNIFEVLLWFRSHRFVFSSDIVKMYRQILLHPDDQDLQRIFWHDANEQVISYRLTTVTYGLSCAPFLAFRTLQQLIEDEGHRFPKAIAPLTKGLLWQPHHDAFSLCAAPSSDHVVTKRLALSETAQIYDPLGFISPVV
ncbi:PREDICTED: uncharacterized protein LOC108771563, partial [Cyphomyrmex costatus]|uniref:uncharacterized protein LOC108771563 n=1 Tax=Cyphomyrmex costatus TaxID=456900 RepID=UPI000852454C